MTVSLFGCNEHLIDSHLPQNSTLISQESNLNQFEGVAQINLMPFVSTAVLRLNFHGIDNEELIDIFGSNESPAILIAALYLDEYYLPGIINAPDPTNPPNLFDCLMRSIGIDAAIEIMSGKLEKTALRAAVRKIAVKYLGWAGAAWAIYEFGSCMDWYGIAPPNYGNEDIFSRNENLYLASNIFQ